MTTQKKFWIIIPAYDCEPTLGRVIAKVRAAYPDAEIVVVDDGSRDRTATIARDFHSHVLVHAENRGVGRAVKSGVAHALESGAEILVTLGADDQRDVEDVGKLVDALSSGSDIAIGSKFLLARPPMPIHRKVGNILIRQVFNWLFSASFTDVTTGFRAFNRRVAADLANLADGYPFDVDLYRRVLQRGYRWREVPVRVFYHENSTRMKGPFRVGASILILMVWRRIQSARIMTKRDPDPPPGARGSAPGHRGTVRP